MLTKKQLYVLILSLCIGVAGLPGMAQNRVITGMITDAETNEALVGASVLVEGTSEGTITNVDGAYQLTLQEGSNSLVISFVGYEPKTVAIGNRSVVDVSMDLDVQALNEVVVVGYGTQEKVNVTGAVVPIDVERLEDRPLVQTSSALQGLAPGVTVTQNLGTPGTDNSNIRIRGIGSISSDNSPLVLVDGIQVNINDVNPDDIASISVLKDAASASIYGSRAANGVVLITTKRGQTGVFTVDVDLAQGIETPTTLPEYVSLRDQFILEDAIETVTGGNPEWGVAYINDFMDNINNNGPSDQYQNNDWYGAVFRDNASYARQRVSISGGSDRVKGRLSFVNMNQEGLMANSGFNRKSVRANVDFDVNSWFRITSDMFVQRAERVEPAQDNRRIYQMVTELEPYRQMRVGGDLYGWAWRGENPLAYSEAGGNLTDKNDYTLLNFGAEFKPFDGLKITLGFSNLSDNNKITEFTETFDFYLAGATAGDQPSFEGTNPPVNSLRLENRTASQNYYKAIANYEKTFGNHYINVLVGTDALEFDQSSLSAFRQNFPLGISFPQIGLGDREGLDNGGSAGRYTLLSGFGRVNYGLMDKYLFEASFRADGSSRFSEGNKWGYFPAFSAGWRISQEGFLANQNVVSNLKLRASWGKLGNQNIGSFYPYQFLVDVRQPTVINETSQLGGAVNQWAFNNISWEESTQTDIGLDFGFLEDRLTGSVDYYIKQTDQVLLLLASVPSSGLDDNFQNGASIENKGIEVMLGWRDKIGDLGYRITGQIDDNTNVVTSLSNTGPYINNNRIRQEGETFDALYGYVSDGYLSASDLTDTNVPKQASGGLVEGSLKFKDLDGNGVIDVDDRAIIGNEFPRLNYSINLGLDYKGLALNVFMQGVGNRDSYVRHNAESFGNHLYSFEQDFYLSPNALILTQHNYGELGLQPNTDNPAMPALGSDNGGFSDFWVQSISYLRVKNITLSYTLPSTWVSQAKLSKVKIYVSADNLFTFTNFYEGFDVEFDPSADGGNGNGFWQYPNVTRMIGGINITF